MGIFLKNQFLGGGVHKKPIWKIHFLGEGFMKNQYIGGNCLKRGAWTFCRFEGRLGQEGVVFLGGGLIPQCTLCISQQISFSQLFRTSFNINWKKYFHQEFSFFIGFTQIHLGDASLLKLPQWTSIDIRALLHFNTPLGLGLTGLRLVLSHISLRVIYNKGGGGMKSAIAPALAGRLVNVFDVVMWQFETNQCWT